MSKRNHYEELGLDLSAPPSAIAAAVERLAERADALAYTSPERSQQMWEHIRDIKRDLLSGPEARSAYLRRLREAPVVGDEAPAAPTAASPTPHAPHIHWPVVFGAALTVLIALVVAAVIRYPHSLPHPPPRPVALAPETSGPRQDDAYVSGRRVSLTWHAVPHAVLYRIQIATALPGASTLQVFRHPKLTWLTTVPHYSIKVSGAQQYYWRVQPNVGGGWGHFSATQRFLVARPAVGTPRALRPADNTAQTTDEVRLCWSSVPSAAAYRLSLSGSPRRTVRGTCARGTLPPGAYSWTVSALVRGVALYAGAASPAFHFVVLAPVARHSTRLIAARGPTARLPARRVSRPLRHAPARSPGRTASPGARRSASRLPRRAVSPAPGPQPVRVSRRRLTPAPRGRRSPASAAPAPPVVAVLPPTPAPHIPASRASPPQPARGRPRRAQPAWGRPRPAATVTGQGGVLPTVRPATRPPLPPSPLPTTTPPPAPAAIAAGVPPAPIAAPSPLPSRPSTSVVYRPAPASPYAYRSTRAAPAPRPSAISPPSTPAGPGAAVPVGPLRRP